MTPQPQQESIIDKMMQDYDCIFYPMCWRARELLYCPKKAGMVDCEDYRSRPHPATDSASQRRIDQANKVIKEIEEILYIGMHESIEPTLKEAIAILRGDGR